MAGRDDEVKSLFAQNNMHYDWTWDSRGNLAVSVVNGDWKHDHVALDCLMGKNGYEKVGERYSGIPTGGDWYSAVHVFNKKETGNDA